VLFLLVSLLLGLDEMNKSSNRWNDV